MPNLKIRKAVPQDAQQIGYVHYHAWLETYTGLIDEKYLETLSEKRSTKIFESTACKDVYVAVSDGKIVGFCGCCKARDMDLSDDCGEIHGIYILRAFQKMGIGKRFIDCALKTLKDSGFKKAVLWVLYNNKNAIDFYERNGFIDALNEKEEKPIDSVKIKEKRYITEL